MLNMGLPAYATLGSILHARATHSPRTIRRYATTGCSNIDAGPLDGGLRYGEITTVAGASGAGKTLVYPMTYSYASTYRTD